MATRTQRIYDHRLVRLVQDTGDTSLATRLGVPRSTAAGWVRRARRPVSSAPGLDGAPPHLLARLTHLEQRVRRLSALLRVLLAVFHVVRPNLKRLRIPGEHKARLLRAIDRSRHVVGLRRVLRLVGLSPSRLSAWRRAALGCDLEDRDSCPGSAPQSLTVEEIGRIREMVVAPEFRHVPTGRLALLAQRLGRVFASPSTWHRLVRERGWRRPRLRIHPKAPREGIRAKAPNELWHIDTTILRLLDGTRAYLHAVIDNYSRRILAWHVLDRFDVASTVRILAQAARTLGRDAPAPTLLADDGVENFNGRVDELLATGFLRRVLAQTEIRFSNSLIEAWWRSLKHGWLFLHPLDSVAKVRELVAFYVEQHNTVLPHGTFEGQTPDEMFFGTGAEVPARLAERRAAARERRLAVNRARRCAVCA